MVKAVYPGTFDPITNGHLDIINRSLKFCDQLEVAIGINSSKKTLFSVEERISQVTNTFYSIYKKNEFFRISSINISSFQGLLVEYAKEIGSTVLIRGIRSVSDFEYEINLANINKVLAPEIETIFLPTSPNLAVVSSSMVKEVAKCGGDIRQFVPANIVDDLDKKFGFVKYSDA